MNGTTNPPIVSLGNGWNSGGQAPVTPTVVPDGMGGLKPAQNGSTPPGTSPTVVTDANTRESTIPNIKSDSSRLLATPSKTDSNGQPINSQTGNTNTGTNDASSNKSYEDIYNSVLGGLNNQPVDPVSQSILDNIKAMRASSDASTAAQLDSIHSGYQQREALLNQANESSTAQLRQLLGQGGSMRTGSGAQVLDAKAMADVQGLTNLTNEENAAKAEVYKAQQANDFQLMDKANQTLKDIQDRKYNLASDISKGIQSKNESDRTYNLEVDRFNQTKTQDAIANKEKDTQLKQTGEQIAQGQYEFRDMKDDFGNTIGTQVFNKATGKPISVVSAPGHSVSGEKSGVGGMLNPVQNDANGVPDTKQQSDFLKSLPAPIALNVKSLGDYERDPKSVKAGPTRDKMLAWAQQYNPNYRPEQFDVIHKVNLDYTSGKTATNIKSLNTSINHAGDLAHDFVNLPNGNITKFNSVKEWFLHNGGSGDPTKVMNDLNALGGELAKTYKGTAGTDAEIANIEKGININSSPAQFKAFIESSMNLLGGRLGALDDSYVQATGQKLSRPILNPSSAAMLSKLKDSGYDINVPGVNFSDPVAYASQSPDNKNKLDTIRGKFPELTPAQALQLAQSLDQ